MPAANHYKFLRCYVEKYPDRVGLVNVILSVHNLGALEPELASILMDHTNHVLRLSGKKTIEDNKPVIGTVVRHYNKPAGNISLTNPNKRKKSRQVLIYEIMQAKGHVSVAEIQAMFGCNVKRVANYISYVKLDLLAPDEYIQSATDGSYVDNVRNATYFLKKRQL